MVAAGTSGIGAAIAQRWRARGGLVLLGHRGAPPPPQTGVLPLPFDLRADLTETAARAADLLAGRRLAGLVLNGAVEAHGPIELQPLPWIAEDMDVGYLGAVRAIQAFLPQLRQHQGRIVTFSSVHGSSPAPGAGPSCATRAAVEALSDVLRLELRRFGVHVAIIQPAVIDTPLWDKVRDRFADLPAWVPPDRLAVWYPNFAAALAQLEADEARLRPLRRPPADVAAAVLHALLDRRPRDRYPIGWEASLFLGLRRALPRRLFDRIAGRVFRDVAAG